MTTIYNYLDSITSDVLLVLPDHPRQEDETREDYEQRLNDDLWVDDSVTGNGSGSYWFSSFKAQKALLGNLELLAEACSEFGCTTDILKDGAEACDVTIRCYLLGQAIAAALDSLENE